MLLLEEFDGATVPLPHALPFKCGEILHADVLGCFLGFYFHSTDRFLSRWLRFVNSWPVGFLIVVIQV